MNRNVNPVPPIEDIPPTVGPKQMAAGGLGAILSSMKHALSEMGLWRSWPVLKRLNQKRGFDCPGCAWPDPDHKRSAVEFCENGVKAVAEEATRKTISSKFFAANSVEALSEKSDHWLGKQGRLCEPLWLAPDSIHYQPISWSRAFSILAESFKSLDSPDEAAFYTSGRTSNEAAYLYQLLVRRLGTNNLPDCSNMCHESSGVALTETIGIGKGTIKLEDFEHAKCIIVIGQNPGTNHPRMLSALQTARHQGCEIININPIPEAGSQSFKHPQKVHQWIGKGTSLNTLYLQVRVNGDVAALQGISKVLLASESHTPNSIVDWSFVKESTEGFKAFQEHIESLTWDAIEAASGIKRDRLEKAANIIARQKKLIVCWAMGLTQHKNAVSNLQEIINLLLLGGNFGKQGAGACPVRGHSNVQGDRSMGIWEKPPAEFLQKLKVRYEFEPPIHHGYDTVHTIEAMLERKVRLLFAMGGNFLSATPDTELTGKALGRCELTAHVSTKLNRSHLITGKQALILPCLGRTERDCQAGQDQFVTVENSMGFVHKSMGTLKPASKQLKSEVAIVCELAKTLFPTQNKKLRWSDWQKDYNLIREEISNVIPGFQQFNQTLQKESGFYLPNPVRDSREFPTSNGKAKFTVHSFPRNTLASDQFLMMTIRSHDQYNTTIYGLNDRYRGITNGRRVVFMNPQDMKNHGFEQKSWVNITSHYNGRQRTATRFLVVGFPIARQCVATYFPEANVLVPLEHRADKSNTPASKSVVVSFTKIGDH